MPQSESVQPDAQVLLDLYNNPVQAFKALGHADHPEHYTDYFFFALKQDSSLADTLTNKQWQNLLAGQDGQIDAAKLADMLANFTYLTECDSLKDYVQGCIFACTADSSEVLTNVGALSAEHAQLIWDMKLTVLSSTEVGNVLSSTFKSNSFAKPALKKISAQLRQKIAAHRKLVFAQVDLCVEDQQKINALLDQISAGSTDRNAINGDVLKSIFEDIQTQKSSGNLTVDNTTTVHVNKKDKEKTTGAKDPTEKRIAGQKAQYSYLVTGDGEIIITPKQKTTGSKQRWAKFKGSFKKVDKVVLLTLDQEGNFELKQQVLVHQNLGEYHNKKLESAQFSADVRADAPGAKTLKDGYFLVGRKPLTLGDDILKSGSYGQDKIKGLVSMTFAQVIASQAKGAVMGDIKPENVYGVDNGKPCVIFDQRARGDKKSELISTLGTSLPIFANQNYTSYAYNSISRAVKSLLDVAYVDTFGMLMTLYTVTNPEKNSGLSEDFKQARDAIFEILQNMVKCMKQLGNAECQSTQRDRMVRTPQNKEKLPLLHEVLCRKMSNSETTIGDALGGPAVFDITLPNGMEKFADLGAKQIERLPQIFTDKMIEYEFNQQRLEREAVLEDKIFHTVSALLRERRNTSGLRLRKQILPKTRGSKYYDNASKNILNAIKTAINSNQKEAAVQSSNAEILANMQIKLDGLLTEMKDSGDKSHQLYGKSKQEVAKHIKGMASSP